MFFWLHEAKREGGPLQQTPVFDLRSMIGRTTKHDKYRNLLCELNRLPKWGVVNGGVARALGMVRGQWRGCARAKNGGRSAARDHGGTFSAITRQGGDNEMRSMVHAFNRMEVPLTCFLVSSRTGRARARWLPRGWCSSSSWSRSRNGWPRNLFRAWSTQGKNT